MRKQKRERTLAAVWDVYPHVLSGRELGLQVNGRGVTMESVVRTHGGSARHDRTLALR